MSFHKIVLYGISIIGLILSVVVLAREDEIAGSNRFIFWAPRSNSTEPWEVASFGVQFLNQEIEMNGKTPFMVLLWKPLNSPQNYSEVQFDCPMSRVILGEYRDEVRDYQVVSYTPRDVSCVRVFHLGNKNESSWSVVVLSENNFAIRSTLLTSFALRELLSQYRQDLNMLSWSLDTFSQSGMTMGSAITRKYQKDIKLEELNTKITFLQNLLQQRGKQEKYASPVPWYRVPLWANIIPWAGRPYRKDTTDGIHHGWDIYARVGTPVAALDDGYILRRVSAFEESDFERLDRSQPLTPEKQAMNLDVYRGNQVWLLTNQWEIIFYSHLDSVADIPVGAKVSRWDMLGTIGISGVPGHNYSHPHLHFEIQLPNLEILPRFIPKLETMLSWSWAAKDMKRKEVQKVTKEIFYWVK